MSEAKQPWFLRTSRWQMFRDVPWKRLWNFLLAVFLLFSVIGFYSDLMFLGRTPFAIVLVLSAISGLDAAVWVAVAARLPLFWFIPLGLLQYPLGLGMDRLAYWMGRNLSLHAPTTSAGVRFAAASILVVVMVSYVLFIRFFRAEAFETTRIRNELALAHGIQKTLVPPISLRTERFEVYGISEPSDKVGGDLVDAVLLPGGDIIAYVADIAGHGLSAGILMGMLKTAARTALLDAGEGPASASLPALLEKLNQVLPQVKEPQMYATLTAFRLNADGSAWYAMAASPPVLHWSAERRDRRLMQEKQYPLGLLPVSGFTGEAMEIAPGDLVVVATDGVLEVCNRRDEEFGIERVETAIGAEARAPLTHVAERILRDTRAFGAQVDDQTLLVIRRVK
ncbi:MAG TPA: PP2C family protein-serine/threonine phosphatase [Acidobacteriaceae bacterium]|jgi:serine phosphatase RsbU (regulator of sigma subunit)|nr:PP2C family protein-serine/threonine phosphatase [Acidobacteriaceae bacterium]